MSDGLNKTEQAQLAKLLAKQDAAGCAQIEKIVDGPIAQAIEGLKVAGAVIKDEAALAELRSFLNVLVHQAPKLRDAATAAKVALG